MHTDVNAAVICNHSAKHRTMVETTRIMLCTSKLPKALVAEPCNTAAAFLSQTAHQFVTSKSPYEVWSGRPERSRPGERMDRSDKWRGVDPGRLGSRTCARQVSSAAWGETPKLENAAPSVTRSKRIDPRKGPQSPKCRPQRPRESRRHNGCRPGTRKRCRRSSRLPAAIDCCSSKNAQVYLIIFLGGRRRRVDQRKRHHAYDSTEGLGDASRIPPLPINEIPIHRHGFQSF